MWFCLESVEVKFSQIRLSALSCVIPLPVILSFLINLQMCGRARAGGIHYPSIKAMAVY